ncbi:MAG: ribonuclease HI family protein [Planctomycetes bacterium]|nr:ribonuclease HI family protein [Planctomycetota bacterium]
MNPSAGERGRVVRLWADGASRNNPGPAAAGWVIDWGDGTEPESGGRTLGVASNNVAEYKGLIHALERALERGAGRIDAFADSELLVRQVNGIYKVKHPNLKPLHAQVKSLVARLESFSIRHIPREQNRGADAAANRALDEGPR